MGYPICSFHRVGSAHAAILEVDVEQVAGGDVNVEETQARADTVGVFYGRFMLRHYRLFARTPYLDVSSTHVLFHLPSFFGSKHNLAVPIREVAVVDLNMTADPSEKATAVYVTPLHLPYLATTTANMRANVTLLFATPQRIPPLRWGGAMTSGLGRRASRSDDGVMIDGAALRAVRPRAAIDAVAGAGAVRVADGDAWLRAHRETTSNPIALEQVASITRRNRVSSVLVFCAVVLAGVARVLADHTNSWLPFPLLGAVLVAGFGIPALIRRRNAKARQVIEATTHQSDSPTTTD